MSITRIDPEKRGPIDQELSLLGLSPFNWSLPGHEPDVPFNPWGMPKEEQKEEQKYIYPRKLGNSSDELDQGQYPVVDLASLKHALQDGLNPNVLWTEDELVTSIRTTGCIIPSFATEDDTWPHWNTPLHRAIWIQDFEGADILLQHGADINLFNSMGQTVLHEAVWHGRRHAVTYVLEHGADPNKRTVRSKVLYKHRDMDVESEGDYLALHFAMLRGWDADIICLLLNAQTDLKATPFDGPWTFLDLALLAREKYAVKMLLSRGASLSICSPTLISETISTDHTNAASDLLAIVASNRLVPPRDLHDVYCHSVCQIKLLEWSDYDDAAIDELVQALFDRLCDIAKMKIPQGSKDLCCQCSAFESAASRSCGIGMPFKFQLYQTRQHLMNSASKGCPLCGLAVDALSARWDHFVPSRMPAKTDNKSDTWIVLVPAEIDKSNEESAVYFSLSMHRSRDFMERDICEIIVECGEGKINLYLKYLDCSVIASVQTPDDRGLGTGSPKALLTAREWLHTCRSSAEHSVCQASYRQGEAYTQTPTRVLCIAGSDCEPFLVEGKNIQAPYCALSYCWGSSTSIITTQANLMEHMRAIPIASLAVVVQDAIFTARELGFQYIWIDAICIIQDDPEDWDREASKMHDIYSNAELTISSLVAKDCMDRLFLPRSLWTSYPVPLKIWPPKQYRPRYEKGKIYYIAAFPSKLLQRLTVQGPVHSRGWTLQEQLLSTRILYFGDGILYWDCLCKYVAEVNPTGCLKYQSTDDTSLQNSRSARHTIRAIQDAASYDSRNPSPYEVWKSQLEIYSSRNLTNPSDRLPAFLAFSKRMEKIIGNEFLGGVWNGDRLLESLCWSMKTPCFGEVKMPSWTWATLNGEISFKYLQKKTRPIQKTAVVSVNIETNQSQSQVSGNITLKGTLHKMRDFEFESKMDSKKDSETLRGDPGQSFDRQVDVLENCYALDILSFDRGPMHNWYGLPQWFNGEPPSTIRLLLQPVTGDLTTFVRIGVGKYFEEDEEDQRPINPPHMWLRDSIGTYFNKVVIII